MPSPAQRSSCGRRVRACSHASPTGATAACAREPRPSTPRVAAAPGATSTTQGIYLFGFATAALLLALLSTLGKPFFSVLLSLAVARMVFAGYYDVGGAHEWLKVAGGFGIALAALAMYGGTALGLEDARQRAVLALFRRAAADTACSGFEAQLDRLEAEAGVHQQL